MADNEDKRTPEEEKPPEDFRPVIPEPEIRRRSIYDFSKNYPENDSPTSTHTESFAQQEFKRKLRRNVLYCLALLLVFSAAFVLTSASIKISNEPLPVTTAKPTAPSTAVQVQTQPSTEEVSEESSEPETESETTTQATTRRETTTAAPTTQPPAQETTTSEPTTAQEISTAPTGDAQTTNFWQGVFGQ